MSLLSLIAKIRTVYFGKSSIHVNRDYKCYDGSVEAFIKYQSLRHGNFKVKYTLKIEISRFNARVSEGYSTLIPQGNQK